MKYLNKEYRRTIELYKQASHEQRQVSWVSEQLGISSSALYSRKAYLKRMGIELPKLTRKRQPRTLCSMVNCTNVTVAQGLCMKHYKRLRRHGDPSVNKYANRKQSGNILTGFLVLVGMLAIAIWLTLLFKMVVSNVQ